MDVTDKESIQSCADNIDRVDILINNAALNPKMVTKGDNNFETYSLDNWNKSLAVNLTGAFLCSQVFIKKMVDANIKGVVINIASDLGVIAPDQRIYENDVKPVDYSVTKHGIIGLTKYLATYYADKGIRINSLSPGGVYTNQSKDFVERLSKLIPMGRMADKHEYKGAVVFLCSNASSYMNGHNLIMDGGRTVW
jgi:NAD(P)-dependent dehydrogenase (short-subunit alcohol dehydrogenase family)